MRRLVAALIALCLILASAPAGAAERLRVGLTRTPGAGPLLIAAKNYFADEGVDARLVFLPSDALVAKDVASGDLDIGLAELDAAFFAVAAAQHLVLLASAFSDQAGYPANALLIGPKASGLRTVRDLPGKRIGMTAPGVGVRYSLQRVALRYRIDPAAIQTVWLKTDAGELAALARGEIDAAMLPFAMALTSRQSGKGASLMRLSDLNQWQEGVVFARRDTIEARRPAIAAFIRAYQRGAADYDLTFQQRGDEGHVLPGPYYADYLKLIGDQANLSPALLEQTLRYCDHLARLDATDVARQLAFWQDLGLVDKRVAPGDLIDVSFIGEPIR